MSRVATAVGTTPSRRHHGFELLQRAYRTAQARFSQMWLEQLRTRSHDVDELAQTFGFFNDWLFAWVETLESRLTEYYMAERERHLRGVTAMRAEEVGAILAGASVDILATSRRLRYELGRGHVAFVIWAGEAQLDRANGHLLFAAMEQLAAETAELIGALDHLTVPLHGYLACWAGFRGPAAVGELPPQFLAGSRRGLGVALGQLGKGIAGSGAATRRRCWRVASTSSGNRHPAPACASRTWRSTCC
jgi:hypothetical protein